MENCCDEVNVDMVCSLFVDEINIVLKFTFPSKQNVMLEDKHGNTVITTFVPFAQIKRAHCQAQII